MSAQLINGANHLNASVAGLTSATRQTTTRAGLTATEAVSQVTGADLEGLDYLFSSGGGLVGQPTQIPTGSTAGRLGGLVPTGAGSGVQPGPSSAAPGGGPKTSLPTIVTKLRSTFGV